MIGAKLLKSKTARSILYLITIGGLFIFFSLMMLITWNYIINPFINISDINLLESAGVVSFIYIFIFAVKFGLTGKVEDDYDKMDDIKDIYDKVDANADYMSEEKFEKAFMHLNKQEQDKLRVSINKCCGNGGSVVSEN